MGHVSIISSKIKETENNSIGAHIGDTTLPIALAAGKKGFVLALEPNPYVFHVFPPPLVVLIGIR